MAMNPNLLSFVLRKNLVNFKRGKLSRSKYNKFINGSFKQLNNPSFNRRRNATKRELIKFKRLI